MPHDFKGNLLNVGDNVIFVGKISQITMCDEYCNIQVDSTLPAKPAGAMATFWFNANQVVKGDLEVKLSVATTSA